MTAQMRAGGLGQIAYELLRRDTSGCIPAMLKMGMILSRSDALLAIRDSLATVNSERPAEDQIPVSDETALLGRDAALDSLAFVTFVADLEERLLGATGRDFVLVGEAVASGG